MRFGYLNFRTSRPGGLEKQDFSLFHAKRGQNPLFEPSPSETRFWRPVRPFWGGPVFALPRDRANDDARTRGRVGFEAAPRGPKTDPREPFFFENDGGTMFSVSFLTFS